MLIVNQHMAVLYAPHKFAFGGHLGNSIFYLISGYGLSSSFMKHPLMAGEWFRRRLLKVVIPLVFIIGILNIGDLQGFTVELLNQLVWHKVEQLEYFLPVLWVLYALFIPLYKMKLHNQKMLLTAMLFSSLVIFLLTIHSLQIVPSDLPSKGVFFAINGLICFTLGIIFNGIEMERVLAKYGHKVLLLPLIIFPQILHKVIIMFAPRYVFLNFYLNLVCVIALFLLFLSINKNILTSTALRMRDIASSSLAVYLVHFGIIKLAKEVGIIFPFNIFFVFAHSFLWAYAATKIINGLNSALLAKLEVIRANNH